MKRRYDPPTPALWIWYIVKYFLDDECFILVQSFAGKKKSQMKEILDKFSDFHSSFDHFSVALINFASTAESISRVKTLVNDENIRKIANKVSPFLTQKKN